MNTQRQITGIILFLIYLTVPLFSEDSPLLKTYLPSYRVTELMPRDLKGETLWYAMAPYSEVSRWRRRN